MRQMQTLLDEFKRFAFRGNMLDLAVGVVIGTAFAAVVNSLVKNIIMPLISYVTPAETGYRAWHLGRIEIGAFMSELLNFLVIATAVFLVIVKIVGTLMQRVAPPPAPAAMKECPYCFSNIPAAAVKCGHCTSDLGPAAAPAGS